MIIPVLAIIGAFALDPHLIRHVSATTGLWTFPAACVAIGFPAGLAMAFPIVGLGLGVIGVLAIIGRVGGLIARFNNRGGDDSGDEPQ